MTETILLKYANMILKSIYKFTSLCFLFFCKEYKDDFILGIIPPNSFIYSHIHPYIVRISHILLQLLGI